VQCHGANFERHDKLYSVLTLARRGDLFTVLHDEHDFLNWNVRLQLAITAAIGLNQLHAIGVIHRGRFGCPGWWVVPFSSSHHYCSQWFGVRVPSSVVADCVHLCLSMSVCLCLFLSLYISYSYVLVDAPGFCALASVPVGTLGCRSQVQEHLCVGRLHKFTG
jgi:hypothetical protein